MFVYLNHFAVHLKLTQSCNSPILHLTKRKRDRQEDKNVIQQFFYNLAPTQETSLSQHLRKRSLNESAILIA